ncbi:MAG TPA: ADP-ribosylglycohydrolase family protein [Phycisphaerae bacterium]|nr:ADP-ribosylglycohydrolase family protein [Phycisphaerae bacterium]
MILNRDEYRSKVLGCWMGKNIGGTLGAPFEWRRQLNDVSFYTQELGGEPLPNDDLDIQLLWLVALEERGVEIDAKVLSEYWLIYVTPHWSEYGNAKANLRAGLLPPLSGSCNNDYKHSCGAFIRSEIWACITPGCPHAAARYAYQDAILDHGDGEGTYGEVFTAALESAAFVETDVGKLIRIGLSYIPDGCGVAGAVRSAVNSHQLGHTWVQARDAILEKYRGGSFAGDISHTSQRDREKGFHTGRQGWDVPSNIGLLMLGLLYGEGDFDKTLCTTVNCGEDTDCTGATVGSLFGILHGIDAIPDRWIQPIGRKIKTLCLNLGDLGQVPRDVDNMTDRTERIARQVIGRRNLPVEIADRPTDLSSLTDASLFASDGGASLYAAPRGPVFRFDFFDVAVDYGDAPYIRDHVPKAIGITIRNHYRVQATVNVHWYAPEGWRVRPSADGTVFLSHGWLGGPKTLEFIVEAEQVRRPANRLVVELTIDGRPLTMLVPITLLNGSLVPQGEEKQA